MWAPAADPLIAREKIKALNPDVMTLDIEMPHMDGLSFLDRVMSLRPMPVIIISSLTARGTDTALQALARGAVDVVGKPSVNLRTGMADLRAELVAKLRAAARIRPQMPRPTAAPKRLAVRPGPHAPGRIVAIGASTGGVEAIQRLLMPLPAESPPVIIVQHMPPGFTASFASRLHGQIGMPVSEAQDRQPVQRGHAYIANGAHHLQLARAGTGYMLRFAGGEKVSGHLPSVDVLFASVARVAGAHALGVILTGMGRDGAAGLLEMRQAGAKTLGESEASCLVYGMSKAAWEAGAVQAQMDIEHLAAAIAGH